MASVPPSRLRTAFVRRVHGVHGEVRAEAIGGDPTRFRPGMRTATEPGERELSVRSARDGGDGTVLLAFEEIDTPEAARSLCGTYLTVPTETARPLGDDEWFVWQLHGLAVRTPDGEDLGVVDDVESGVANDVLVVRGAGGVRRFPMVREFVRRVDVDSGLIVLLPQPEEQA